MAAAKRLVVTCPNCRAKLGIRKDVAKPHVACPKCQAEVPTKPNPEIPATWNPEQPSAATPQPNQGLGGIVGVGVFGVLWAILLWVETPITLHCRTAVLIATLVIVSLVGLISILEGIGLFVAGSIDVCAEELAGTEVALVESLSHLVAQKTPWVHALILMLGGSVGVVVGWSVDAPLTKLPPEAARWALVAMLVFGWYVGDFTQRVFQGRSRQRNNVNEV